MQIHKGEDELEIGRGRLEEVETGRAGKTARGGDIGNKEEIAREEEIHWPCSACGAKSGNHKRAGDSESVTTTRRRTFRREVDFFEENEISRGQ